MVLQLRGACVVLAAMMIATGVVYPLAVTGAARVLFPERARGSMIVRDGRVVGSRLIGQDFGTEPKYFWGRPSATAPAPYTAFDAKGLTGSSGSNLGPTNPALVEAVAARIAALRDGDRAVGYDRPARQGVPVDLVTASGSGLDPHISPAAAEYQVARVARARGVAEEGVRALVARHTHGRQLGVLGEPVVSVLELNLELDREFRGGAQ